MRNEKKLPPLYHISIMCFCVSLPFRKCKKKFYCTLSLSIHIPVPVDIPNPNSHVILTVIRLQRPFPLQTPT